MLCRVENRRFTSEFKRFFGYDGHLEETKIKNDKDTEFDMNKMRYLAMLFTSSFIGIICFLMVSPKRREHILSTSRWLYVRSAIFFKTEQIFSNVDKRFDLIVELTELTINS